jgi:hypothetical protein
MYACVFIYIYIYIYIYRLIKTSLYTWWLQYKNKQKYLKQFQSLTMITLLELGITDGVSVSIVSINVWRLAGGTSNIACNFLYCNHQVHRDFLITLYHTNTHTHTHTRGGEPKIPGIVKKYLKQSYNCEPLIPFKTLPLWLDAEIPAPPPLLETLSKIFSGNAECRRFKFRKYIVPTQRARGCVCVYVRACVCGWVYCVRWPIYDTVEELSNR